MAKCVKPAENVQTSHEYVQSLLKIVQAPCKNVQCSRGKQIKMDGVNPKKIDFIHYFLCLFIMLLIKICVASREKSKAFSIAG